MVIKRARGWSGPEEAGSCRNAGVVVPIPFLAEASRIKVDFSCGPGQASSPSIPLGT